MARLKLKLPAGDSYLASFSYRLRIDDMNYGGHLSNDRVLALCHDARVSLLQQREMSELRCAGRGLVMNEGQVVYKAEGFQGDLVQVDLYLGEYSRTGFELFYHLKREGPRACELARVKTGQVFFDFEERKMSPLESEEELQSFHDYLLDS